MPQAQEIIAFVESHPEGVSTEMVAENYGMRYVDACSRLGKLFDYGKIHRIYEMRERKNKPTWKAKEKTKCE